MVESRLTVGELAKTSGVTAKTVRYYEEVGVLPAARRGASGYRLYDRSAVERLTFIRRARSLGLSLRQLKTLISTLDCQPRPALRPRLRALVGEQLSVVKNQMAELDVLRQELEHVLERMSAPRPGPDGRACRCLEPAHPRPIGPQRSGRRAGDPSPKR
jgi:DNA-binding transcriptional MerR regulator